MILKASQRGGGRDLAIHLMRVDDNEHVRVHELRGFASDDLRGAFKEAEAISRSTRCKQYLFSVSFNPPADARVDVAGFEDAIARVEGKLGLDGQPRAIVFHEKDGRRHAHCVWSRIDADTMTARQLSFFKTKLTGLSRELYLENGWKLPDGLKSPSERNPTNFTLDEWQQAKRQGIDPRWLKQTLQACWKTSDSRKALEQSLTEHGLFLARGDKRGFVVLDHQGEVWSLPRLLDLKTKEVRTRLGDGEDLKSVDDTQKIIGARMTPAIRRHVAESRERFSERARELGRQKQEMTHAHRALRTLLDDRLSQIRDEKIRELAARLPKGLRGIWHRITGRYQEVRAENEREAKRLADHQAKLRQLLIDKQLEERRALQKTITALRQDQARTLLDLRRDVGRFLKLSRGHEARSQTLSRSTGLGLRLGR